MGRFALQVGGHIDTVTPHELAVALADQDVRLRADLSGVKFGELFLSSSTIGPGLQTFSSSGTMTQSPGNGFLWAVMSMGLELSVSSQVRLYKGTPQFAGPGTIAPSGNGRLITTFASFVTPSGQFSKGQFTLKSGDTFTAVMVTAGSILSIYLAYIEVPVEKQGELWL
jgi:hypothetical protein